MSFVTRCRDIFHRSRVCLLLLAFCVLPHARSLPAAAATLEDLLDGATLNVGNLLFSSWELVSLDSTQSVVPDLSLITVTPFNTDPAKPGFQLNGNGQLSIAGMRTIDLSLKFRVDALNGRNMMTGQTLAMNGINFTNSSGIGFITNELATSGGGNLASMLAIADHESDFFQLTDSAVFLPKSDLIVTTNVFITGLSAVDGITLTSFMQRFEQTGPPSHTGDYNENGVVDAADYVVWRKAQGTTTALPNDDGIGGTVGVAHFNLLRANFGNAGSGAGTSSQSNGAVVPEPTSILMAILAVVPLFMARR